MAAVQKNNRNFVKVGKVEKPSNDLKGHRMGFRNLAKLRRDKHFILKLRYCSLSFIISKELLKL